MDNHHKFLTLKSKIMSGMMAVLDDEEQFNTYNDLYDIVVESYKQGLYDDDLIIDEEIEKIDTYNALIAEFSENLMNFKNNEMLWKDLFEGGLKYETSEEVEALLTTKNVLFHIVGKKVVIEIEGSILTGIVTSVLFNPEPTIQLQTEGGTQLVKANQCRLVSVSPLSSYTSNIEIKEDEDLYIKLADEALGHILSNLSKSGEIDHKTVTQVVCLLVGMCLSEFKDVDHNKFLVDNLLDTIKVLKHKTP